MSITATYDATEAAAKQDAVLTTLLAWEAVASGPEAEAHHAALADLQDFLIAGVNEDSDEQPPARRSGGDKTEIPPGQ